VPSLGLLQRLVVAKPYPGARPNALPLDQQILVNPAEAARYSEERRRHFNVVTYPIVRLVGFQLLIIVLLGHNFEKLAAGAWGPVAAYIVIAEAYCALTWWALVKWVDRIKAFDLGLAFLTADLFLWTGAVYVSGGHTSWMFFLLALRVADQSFVSFRRAAAFAHLAPVSYIVMLVYQQTVDHVAVEWRNALAQLLLLYLSSLYLLMSGRNAEKLRERTTQAVRLARDSIHQLQERSNQLAKAKEEAEAASVAKSQFLANMSHELKTPLNAIIGYSEMLIEDPDADEASRRADLEKIRLSGQHLLGLINEVLELARLESGKSNVSLEEIDVATLAQEAAVGLQAVAQKNKNVMEVSCQRNLAPMLTDAVKLRQILMNLLGNALKFTEGGRVRLEVRTTEDDTALTFRVSDTGMGMSETQIVRLFQPFTQGDGSATRKHGGAALGLTLTKRYCEMLGGPLAVESKPQAGTIFTVTLPLAEQPSADAAQ
jgi:signal transduction histidine kinase